MSRVSRIRQRMGDLDALLLTDPISVRYASEFAFTDGAVIIGREQAFLITDSRYVEAAEAAVTDMTVLCTKPGRGLTVLMKECIAALGTRVGAEQSRLSHAAWVNTEKTLGLTLIPSSGILASLRASKDEAELDSMIRAQRIAEKALYEVLELIRPGLTEKEVAAELVYRMYKYGGEANSFDPIVITGHKTSMPHGVPGQEVIQAGDFVTMDFGTMYNGYCSDMTRTVAVGHATQEMKDIYAIVLEAQLAGIAAAGAGMTGAAIDEAARAVIRDAGYGEYFGHSFGHSLGLEIHEAPNASPSNAAPMPVGAVISAEPGIYLPGRFGVRIEDVMQLGENGSHVITEAPKELLIL